MVSVATVCRWMSAVINREVEEGLCVLVRLFFGGGGRECITTKSLLQFFLEVKGALRGVQKRR